MRVAWLAVALLAVALAGCIGGTSDLGLPENEDPWADWLADARWDTSGSYSKALEAGPYAVLPAERVELTMPDGSMVVTAVWRPEVPDDVQVPVILDIGPYYGGATATITEGTREDAFFLQNFVTHGYAYGRVATRGTGESGGCMEFFGANEQDDVDAVITHYGTQAWSNGRVALYGASYDGTTPWIGAAYGNPHLATIVPVSGLSDVAGLMFRNGTAEGRGIYMHSNVYWLGIGFQPNHRSVEHRVESVCEELVWGTYAGPWSTLTGEHHDLPGPAADYWKIRDWRQRVVDNYDGSVLLVHGMQDWNVEPSMAFPFMRELEDKGLDVKMMLGQWGHDWPDRAQRLESDNPVVQASVRWDWAELLLRWFDKHLMDNEDRVTGPGVDIQDNQGAWRTEETWPPADLAWRSLYLGTGTLTDEPASAQGGMGTGLNPDRMLDATLNGDPLGPIDTRWSFDLGPLAEDLRFAGLPRVHVTVTPTSPLGGNLRADLLDIAPDGTTTRTAHGVMNLRYHDGGTEPQTLTPGESITARMELFPADVLVPAGHTLRLVIWPDTGSEPRGSPTPTPITLHWGGDSSVLKLPVIERDVGAGMYPGQG